MTQYLKVLIAAAITLVVIGGSGTSDARAVQFFHCSGEPCIGRLKLDGTTKTSHHVFIVENSSKTESVSFTCSSLIGETFQSSKTVSAVEATGLVYSFCTVNGSAEAAVDTSFCGYSMTASGSVELTGCAFGMEITVNGCTFHIPPQTLSGITYTTIGTSPKREVTVSVNLKSINVTATGTTAKCTINPAQTLTGTYTTGNTIVTGEAGGLMADAWFE